MIRFGVLVLLCILPAIAGAQILPNLYMFELSVKPVHPKAGELVTIAVHNPSGQSDTEYVWIVDGNIAERGVGRDRMSVAAGPIGSVKTIVVQAVEGGFVQGQVSAVIRPAEVDIVWEGNTQAFPFYFGRPLVTGASSVTATAIPHIVVNGARVSPSNLTYTWSIDGKTLAEQSGYGKSSISVAPPRFAQPFQLSVIAATSDKRTNAGASASIAPVSPRIAVYEHAPLAGLLFNSEVGGEFKFSEEEVTLSAFPLFVTETKTLTYEWRLGGQVFETDPEDLRRATFRKSGSGAGTHTVTFSFKNPVQFLEHATRSFQLSF